MKLWKDLKEKKLGVRKSRSDGRRREQGLLLTHPYGITLNDDENDWLMMEKKESLTSINSIVRRALREYRKSLQKL